MGLPNTSRYQQSIHDFRLARQRAAMESVVSRLTGKSTQLLSYDDVVRKLKIVSQAERGIEDIPVEAIVGSVGRYTDFSRSFLPIQESDADRWARVASVPDFYQLPPIEVFRIGDVYFVLDGNHRVSIARQRGISFIPAEVIEIKTRAPIPPDISPDKLILQAEYVDFLENTNLDRLRPEADLRVSVPGQYRKLESHMEVHHFYVEMAEGIELSDAEAVRRWYDEAYLPIVKTVREQGLLRDFPNRTEADLYLWISEHQAHLRNDLGWQVRPEVATADLIDRYEREAENKVARLGKKLGRSIINIVVPEGSITAPRSQSWSQSKVAARYSDRLFADLLVLLVNQQDSQPILDQALMFAARDKSQIHGLAFESDRSPQNSPTNSLPDRSADGAPELKAWFEGQCQKAGLEGHLAMQAGDPVRMICARAVLADLIICDRFQFGPDLEPDSQLLALIRQSPRPILLPADKPVSLDHVLLAYDGGAKSKEALFVAAYMAERWGLSLTVAQAPGEGAASDAALNHARSYLEMHEVEAAYVVCDEDPISLVIDTARENEAHLIIAGGHSRQRFGRIGPGDIVNRLVTEWPGALLICP